MSEVEYVIQFPDGVFNRDHGFDADLFEATRYATREEAEKVLEDMIGCVVEIPKGATNSLAVLERAVIDAALEWGEGDADPTRPSDPALVPLARAVLALKSFHRK